MSLLPRGAMRMEGLNITALCVPAREVGGDYYDFFPLDDKRLGVLIADVAGKGTSAALYMAELKGLMLSLSKIHHSPRDLLIQVNSILSHNLDSRSFITMTYVVIDVGARTLTYARAGHTPMLQLPVSNGRRAIRLCCGPTAWWSACRSRVRGALRGCCSKRCVFRSRPATCSCCSRTASPRR